MPDQASKAARVNETPKKLEKEKPGTPGRVRLTGDSLELGSVLQRGDLDLSRLTPSAVIALRGLVGNQVISRWVGRHNTTGSPRPRLKGEGRAAAKPARGLEIVTTPEATVSEGPTTEEAEADVNRPGATAIGNLIGSAAAALTGISISSTTNTGPTWRNRGAFNWQVGFTTSGRNGWIVQEITNEERAEDAEGLDVIEVPVSPHYWEAWAVDGEGAVTPANDVNNDYWTNPPYASGSHGHWSTFASLYFTTTNPATQGFTRRNPHTNAGDLLSSTSAPAGLGMARLFRYAQGTWDSTGTHTGSAG